MNIFYRSIAVCLFSAPLFAATDSSPDSFAAIVNKVIETEQRFADDIRKYSPVAETYLQLLKPDPDFGSLPQGDYYGIRHLNLKHGIKEESFLGNSLFKDNGLSLLLKSFGHHQIFLGIGAEEISLAQDKSFNLSNYTFEFDRQEFLGEVKCFVINVHPKHSLATPRFLGQIWVETRDLHIVRLNGIMTPNRFGIRNFHEDMWRLETRPGVWLPAFTYTEEINERIDFFTRRTSLKAQTRFWGYAPRNSDGTGEHTQIVIGEDVADFSKSGIDRSAVENTRVWESSAEANILRRLQKDSLLSPPGNVDRALDVVINNLLASNDLDIQPDVHCRILLTTPLESLSVGHTIIVSRGLLDVLPDENSLALMLAHELAHIALGHAVDTRYAFSDRLMYEASGSLRHLHMSRGPEEEKAANEYALQIMAKSPYGKDLAKAGLFLRAISVEKASLPKLLGALMGSPLVGGKVSDRFTEVAKSAQELRPRDLKQLPALPLGSRIKLDPWNGELKLMKTRQVILLAPREKMSFEVTPIAFYLTRAEQLSPEIALNSDRKNQPE